MISRLRARTSFVRRSVFVTAVCFFLMAVPALAEQPGPSLVDSRAGWIFRWIDFAIIFGTILYFFAKMTPSLRSRSEEIAEKIAEGARAREAAERQRREVREKLAGIDQEVANLREQAQRSMEAESVRLKALARQEAEIIERAAQAEIRAAERSAAGEIKSVAARLAIERAAVVLTQQITPKAQASLFETFVVELERSAN